MEHVTDDILRWSPEEVAALQLGRLRATLALCARGHPAYGPMLAAVGLGRGPDAGLNALEDLERLPLTTKEQFVAAPERYRLDLAELPDEERLVAQVLYTTGSSTGTPAPIYETAWDRMDYLVRARRRAGMIGLIPGDVVLSLFPLTPFPMGAYARCAAEAAASGAALVVANPGQGQPGSPHRHFEEIVALARSHRITVIWGIAGYVRQFLGRAASCGLRMEALRMAMVTGERSSSTLLEEIGAAMEALGARGRRVLNRYGSTEQGSSMVECAPGSGFHDLAPDALYMEVVDPETGQALPDGVEGALAVTHLQRRGTILLRYAVGDRVAISRDPCPRCGRTGSLRIVSGPYRTGDIRKVKGTLVNLGALYDRLAALQGVAGVQVVVSRRNEEDHLVLRLAPRLEAPNDLAAVVLERARALAGVTPEVQLVDPSDLARTLGSAGGKQARIVDQREAP